MGVDELMRASRAEIKIEEIFKMYGIPFAMEYSFSDLCTPGGTPLRFDFAVFDDDGNIDFLLEYQGKQHYEAVGKFGGKRGLFQQQFNDNMKRDYCLSHNIKLIEIPYLDENLISFDYIMQKAGY